MDYENLTLNNKINKDQQEFLYYILYNGFDMARQRESIKG
jgi:hypothetical protein